MFDFLSVTTLSVSQCPEPEDPSVNPPAPPRYSAMCVVCPREFTPGLCVRTPGRTHASQRALFSHTRTTTRLSMNRLERQGHLRCAHLALSSPALFPHTLKCESNLVNGYFLPASFPWFYITDHFSFLCPPLPPLVVCFCLFMKPCAGLKD